MKSIVTALIFVLVACGVTDAQDEPGPGFEHLKCYGPFIGTWRYEGPLLKSVPDIAEKGTKVVTQLSWRRILNKSAVEYNWSATFEGGVELSGKALIGWNADEEKIVYGSMNSVGDLNWGTVTPDATARTLTKTSKGVNGKGEEKSSETVLTKTGKDTLTSQALERKGGIVEGPSPPYTLKRVERAKKKTE
ncbi:hypothetical protein NZK35_25265 [Stieleria sp. ICT_E10.1]|uniref:hypothetical protein n=1 Tax=Stieleria sedimenti TaxID=2976331 RepID=UPI00217F93BB|nr:hypothetical protein [Stieleria sedimenti]MCS7469974.1 hypothetical protein [Stieleria sedimenti]